MVKDAAAVPLHGRLAGDLRERILSGALAVGDPVPSEAALGQEFGASRGTVRQALATLRSEGLIDGGRGRQPVVRRVPIGQPFDTFLSFTAWAQMLGRRPGQRTVEVAKRGATPEAAAALGLSAGDPIIDVLRLRLLDDEPVMVERSSWLLEVGMLLLHTDTDAGSIYAYLASEGVDLDAATHTIDAVAASAADADLLQVPAGAPLLRERRRATDRRGHPLEYGDDRYRPDRATFTISNARTSRLAVVRHLELKET